MLSQAPFTDGGKIVERAANPAKRTKRMIPSIGEINPGKLFTI